MDERNINAVVVAVRSDLMAQFLCLIGHRLLDSPVRNDGARHRGRCSSRRGARSRADEYRDSPPVKADRLTTGPVEGVPGGIRSVDPDDDQCADPTASIALQMVSVLRAVLHSVAVPHDLQRVSPLAED